MIISASRRCDIPAYFGEWMLHRLREGYVLIRNPMNPRQVSRVSLSPDVVDCMVFWSKNPRPMLERLNAMSDYMYYFQYTLNAYGQDIEASLPALTERIETFRRLSDHLGSRRVIWRYDPILLTERYSVDWHLTQFAAIASSLRGFTERCIFSFLDLYPANRKAIAAHSMRTPNDIERRTLASGMAEIARQNNIILSTCAEECDLSNYGITHASCIDAGLIADLIGCPLSTPRDKNQRSSCGCATSIDIGAYNCCRHGCVYCYANHSDTLIASRLTAYDPVSPMLCSKPGGDDRIKERDCRSDAVTQMDIFSL